MKLGKPELLVFGLSLVLRLWLVQHATWWPISDTRDYHALAQSLVQEGAYQQVYEGESEIYEGLVFRAYRMPGYPLVLASIYSLAGWNHFWAYLANVVFEMATLLLVLWLGQRLLDRRTALVAQILFGLHVIWTPSLMTESLFTLLFTALVAAGLHCVGSRSVGSRSVGSRSDSADAALPLGSAVGFGTLLAAAVFVRPIAIVAVVPFLGHFYHRLTLADGTRRRLAVAGRALALGLPLLIGLFLWTVRNQRVLGEPVLLSTNFGAHNAASFGVDHAAVVAQARSEGLGEAGIDRRLRAEIRREVREHPFAALAIYVDRALHLVTVHPAWETELLQELTFSGVNGSVAAEVIYRTLYYQYFLAYLAALPGLAVLAGKRRLGQIGWTLAAFVVLHAVVSDGNIRFAAPLYPILCLLAAAGLLHCRDLVASHGTGRASARRGRPT